MLAVIAASALMTSCNKREQPAAIAANSSAAVDVDITEKMYVTYVNEIYQNTADYIGKSIRIEGLYKEEFFEETGTSYSFVYRTGPGCCGSDGQTCGFEMVYDGKMPEIGDWIRVTGTLEEYMENGSKYFHIVCSGIEYPEQVGAYTVKN